MFVEPEVERLCDRQLARVAPAALRALLYRSLRGGRAAPPDPALIRTTHRARHHHCDAAKGSADRRSAGRDRVGKEDLENRKDIRWTKCFAPCPACSHRAVYGTSDVRSSSRIRARGAGDRSNAAHRAGFACCSTEYRKQSRMDERRSTWSIWPRLERLRSCGQTHQRSTGTRRWRRRQSRRFKRRASVRRGLANGGKLWLAAHRSRRRTGVATDRSALLSRTQPRRLARSLRCTASAVHSAT